MRNVIIIGSGPAGLTAALYAARANLAPLVIEGLESGGQLMLTTMVENFPGHRDGVMGPDLMTEMRAQAERFGAEIMSGDVTAIELGSQPFSVRLGDQVEQTKSLIVATGASARLLGLASERTLMGHGVSTCATCDGYFFRDKPIVVIGGGDTALEEAIFLTKFASQVTVLHRRDQLRASKVMQDKAFANPKIVFEWDTELAEVEDVDQGVVTAAVLRNKKTGATKELPVEGVFIAIGHTPNTGLVKGQLDLDDNGYIVVGEGTRTNVPGVFACGDVQDHVYRQAITAAGTGCMAAIDAERYLEGLE
ncbi:MAG: thioredoxin-disulfide reductase [Vicinamibacterales bacterium]|jgi:thioredoxin reductase (NADPH)|nr:thioredoxin-disulfide reductase [Vicinamibacterales bacterium]